MAGHQGRSARTPGVNRAWIERETGGRVRASRRLHGGIMAVTREVRVDDRTFVLQTGEVDALNTARILTALEAVPIPAPRLVAAREGALLMTKLPGKVHLQPREMATRLRRMAAPLPELHAAKALRAVSVKLRLNPRSYDWVRDPGVRRAAEALVANPPARIARVPTHGDFQHFNMLWSREKLTGIVDWSGIWMGPPEVDVCHCRLNLAVLYSADVAEEFRLAYEAVAGRTVDVWHDVHRLGVYNRGWQRFIPIQVHGRAAVRRGMTARVEELLRRTLDR
jgi:aminoglycoside phosphotransferase (APT) family kinase protein